MPLCTAADDQLGGGDDSRHPPPADGAAAGAAASFGEAFLRDVGVPEARIAGTLAAAATLHGVPASERPLLQCTADAPQLSPEALAGVEGVAAAVPLPWQGGAREAWASAVRSHLEMLQSLGLTPAEAAATLATFPYALLLPAQPGLGPAAAFLVDLGLTPAELANVVRSAPRLLGFSPKEHLEPAVAYLRGCGLRSNALCGLLRSAPTLALGAIEHKARTDRAAEQLGAAYQLQTQERATWAMETATAARAQLRKRGF